MNLLNRLENLFAAVGMAEEGDAETASMMVREAETRCACGRHDLVDGQDCLSNPARA